MFVLVFHKACIESEFLSALVAQEMNAVSYGSQTSPGQLEDIMKMREAFTSCNLFEKEDISRFIRHCIRVKQYLDGKVCKIEYLKRSVMNYDENVSEM